MHRKACNRLFGLRTGLQEEVPIIIEWRNEKSFRVAHLRRVIRSPLSNRRPPVAPQVCEVRCHRISRAKDGLIQLGALPEKSQL
jgi:hypothetical protein